MVFVCIILPYGMPDSHLTTCCDHTKMMLHCVVHGLMSDRHKPLRRSDDYTCASSGIQCESFTHTHTHTRSLLQFQALQLQRCA